MVVLACSTHAHEMELRQHSNSIAEVLSGAIHMVAGGIPQPNVANFLRIPIVRLIHKIICKICVGGLLEKICAPILPSLRAAKYSALQKFIQ